MSYKQNIDFFAKQMKRKMEYAEMKKGRFGWDDPLVCSADELMHQLIDHLHKDNEGNFLDIANYCMMLHQRGEDPRKFAELYRMRTMENTSNG